MPQSSHPGHVTRNIPYSLGYRLKRICSLPSDFLKRWQELKSDLRSRGYKDKVLNAAFQRLEKVTRTKALEKVNKTRGDNKIVFPITYDPRLPSVSESLHKHYNNAKQDPNFFNTFPKCPIVAYKRSRNIGEYLIRSKLYPLENYTMRSRNGFVRCNKNCILCQHSYNTAHHTSCKTKERFDIKSKISCNDTFIIYSISCKRCPNIEYIGQTSQSAVRRFTNHRSDVTSKLDKPVAEHFNLPSHDKSDMIFIPFEKLRKKDATLLNVRERFWINKKETLLHGLNRQ